MMAAPLTPSQVAVMVVEPIPTPVTTPSEETVATAVLDDVHVARVVTRYTEPSIKLAAACNFLLEPTVGGVCDP
jgi:hypothetical protein